MRYWMGTLFVLLTLGLNGCAGLKIDLGSQPRMQNSSQQNGPGMMERGMGSGMMDRHHAQIPAEFAGLTNPVVADEASLARGQEIYTAQCATCHGDYGNGDGPGGAALDPAPAPIAHTAQMMSDAYLFWRITEGGVSFETGMIPYKDILDEQSRWDVINYVRALGQGEVHPVGPKLGGQPFDPAEERSQRAEMLATAVDQEVITQDEAETFDRVHSLMDEFLSQESVAGMETGTRGDALLEILNAMVQAETLSQNDAERFLDVHDRLIEAGLMQ